MTLRVFPDGGFAGDNGGPRRDAPEDWFVWHFTRIENLPSIVRTGALLCDDAGLAHQSVANQDVKARRRGRVVVASGYPANRPVSAHVPWYFAAKSPMQYVVKANADRIVFLGMKVSDAVASGLEWVASNANAAAAIAGFTTDLSTLGNFIDFDLMKQKMWRNTESDMDKMSRRAAEFLVYEEVPLRAVSQVVTKNSQTLSEAQAILSSGGYTHLNFIKTAFLFY